MPRKLKIVLDKSPGMALKRPGSSLIVLNKNGYVPKTGDEKRFAQLHQVQKWEDRVGNGDDVYNGSKIKYYPRGSNRFGYDPGADQDAEYVADKSRTVHHVATEDEDLDEEQLDEISSEKLIDYAPRAVESGIKNTRKAKLSRAFGLKKLSSKYALKANNRMQGLKQAKKRLEARKPSDILGIIPGVYSPQGRGSSAPAAPSPAPVTKKPRTQRASTAKAAKVSEKSAAPKVKAKAASVKTPKVTSKKKALGRGLADLEGGSGISKKLVEWGGTDRSDIGSPSTSNKPNMKQMPKAPKKKMVQDSGQPLNQGDYSLSSGGQLNGGLHEMQLLERTEQRACSLAQHIANHHFEPVFVHKFTGKDGADVFSVMRKRHYDNDDGRFYGYNLTHVIQPTPPKPIRWNKSSKRAASLGEQETVEEAPRKKSALQKYYERKYAQAGGITHGAPNVSMSYGSGNLSTLPNWTEEDLMELSGPVLDMHDNKVPHWPSKPIGEIPTRGQKAAQGVSKTKPGKKLNICVRFSKEMRPGNIHSLGAPCNPGTGGLHEDELYEKRRFLGKGVRTNYAKVLRQNRNHPHPALEKVVEDREDFLD